MLSYVHSVLPHGYNNLPHGLGDWLRGYIYLEGDQACADYL